MQDGGGEPRGKPLHVGMEVGKVVPAHAFLLFGDIGHASPHAFCCARQIRLKQWDAMVDGHIRQCEV